MFSAILSLYVFSNLWVGGVGERVRMGCWVGVRVRIRVGRPLVRLKCPIIVGHLLQDSWNLFGTDGIKSDSDSIRNGVQAVSKSVRFGRPPK